LQAKRPNQQYQSTEGSYKGKQKQHKELGLDRYQYSVSGRYQWYRFGIGIANTAADTRTDTSWT